MPFISLEKLYIVSKKKQPRSVLIKPATKIISKLTSSNFF